MEEQFYIGQVFEKTYPPTVACWCNESGKAYIEEIEPIDGVRRFAIKAIPEPTAEELEAQALAQAKVERAEAVSKITVEVDGMVFDGDEDSQTRMSRTITAANACGLSDTETINWVLADNSIARVTVTQLAQALYKAGMKQTELWVVPYTV